MMAELFDMASVEIPIFEPIEATMITPAADETSGEAAEKIRPTVAAADALIKVATSTLEPAPTATPIILPSEARIEGLNIIPQKFNNCGPANLTISLTYYGHDTEQLLVGEVLKPNYDDRNVSPEELVSYVMAETPLRAAAYSGGDLTVLKQLLSAGFPVIVEKGLILSSFQGWMGHYLTLSGFDEDERNFEVLDTFLGPFDGGHRFIDFDELEARWAEFNYTFLLIYRPEDEAKVETILGAVFLDEASMWQNAAYQAQVGLGKNGQDPFLWFNLGTSLTELGEITGEAAYFQSAAHAFDRASAIGLPWRMLWYQFNPYRAYLATNRLDDVMQLTGAMLTSGGGQNVEETYLYRGHAQLAKNDQTGALSSYKMALKLNPGLQTAVAAMAGLEAADDS
jgi:tetratricopeptide (TPR) repeat protein